MYDRVLLRKCSGWISEERFNQTVSIGSDFKLPMSYFLYKHSCETYCANFLYLLDFLREAKSKMAYHGGGPKNIVKNPDTPIGVSRGLRPRWVASQKKS